ncbi:hypothetical protein RND81_02G217300 [Saponaria officinalis]|uniref:Uncharacterized protein n=1 Tax=Saponaria officinalis TaxID=3572 RepID=A0AAW1MSB6_SAPOF
MVAWLTEKSALMLLVLALIVSCMKGATSLHGSHFVSDSCHEKNSDSSGLVFQANLNDTLFDQLLPNASKLGFCNSTMGNGPDKVYALFYCRGDVDAQTCQECVQAATGKLTDVCKLRKEAIVWFEECTVRFANRATFSIDEEKPDYLYYNTTGIVNDHLLGPYEETFGSTMAALIQQAAYNNGTVPGFATDEITISSTQTLRGLAQCTPDIIGPKCFKCLTTALRLRDTWANTMIFLPSCLFRYDLYGTVSTTSSRPPQLETSPPSPSKGSLPAHHIFLIVVLSVVFILLAVFGGLWLCKCCLKGREPIPNSPNLSGKQLVPVLVPPSESHVDGEGRTMHGFRDYTFAQLKQMTNGFQTQLGRGSYGVVYHGLLLDGSREVAVKLSGKANNILAQIDVFGRISHKNLVSLLGYCKDGTKLGLVYEYMNKRDLRAHLSDDADSLSWIKRLEIAIGTAEGLHYLHNHCEELIVHRDVKPDNILLTGEGEFLQAKVADFGLSKIFPAADVTTIETRVIGTHGYTAPEYYSTGMLNEKADVYSFGVVLLELITGVSPRLGFNLVAYFEKMFDAADIDKILDARVRRDLDYGSVWGATELAKLCVQTNQEKRPDMWEIVVKLRQCLDMEMKRNTVISSKGSTSVEMITALTSQSITMVPEAR